MKAEQEDQNLNGVAQAERNGLGDLAISGLLAVLTFALLRAWAYPGLYPSVWNDAVVATGVRPAVHVMPGFFIFAAQWLNTLFGVTGLADALQLAGQIALSFMAVIVYSILRDMLALLVRARPQFSRRRKFVMRLAAAVGTAGFIAADPVWNAGQCLSETTILLMLTLGAVACGFRFVRTGGFFMVYVGATLLGLLAAETPIGILLPIIFLLLYGFVIQDGDGQDAPVLRPAVLEVGKWHMTFFYFAAFAFGILLNCWTYVRHGGLGAIEQSLGSIPFAYLLGYWQEIAGVTDLAGWLLWVGVCLFPFMVTLIRFPKAADEDQLLPYTTGMVFFLCGVVALSQSVFLPDLWFWTHFPVHSTYFLALGVFCCAVTLANVMAIFGVDVLCRNHARLAKQIYGLEDDESMQVSTRFSRMMRSAGLALFPIVMAGLVLPGRVKTTMRQMLTVIREAVAQTVREAGDAKYLVTDGILDRAVELEAARRGKRINCFSLMGGGDRMSMHLRSRDLVDDEERISFRADTAMGLRLWIRDRPERLKAAAAQLGFDLWKRDGKPLPPMGGLLSRPGGFANVDERTDAVDRAHLLADRVLAIHNRRGGIKSCSDVAVRDAFLGVQWRLARMCRYRSEYEDLRGNVDKAIAESKLAKRLNDSNATYLKLVQAMEKRNESMMQKLTPREGLQLALVRADFTTGKTYAETILSADPENPDANFALGMYYLSRRQLSLAEEYLKRCLIRRPEEPSVYNNLAMIQTELGKFKAAVSNIRKARELLPDSAAVADTKKRLEAAIRASCEKPGKK